MPWLKQDDGMGEHRKTRRLLKRGKAGSGLASFGLYELALLHAAKYLTDGFVDAEFVEETLDDANVAGRMRDQVADALVAGGQWTVVDGGWQIHDYLDHNPSRAETESKREAERAKKSAAGRKGAEVRWGSSNKPPEGTDSSDIAACYGNDGSGAICPDSPVPSRPVPSKQHTGAIKFSGRTVPQPRVMVAELILADFNKRAGTTYKPLTGDGKPTEPFKRILGAIVEHDDLTAEEGVRINEVGLAEPFWQGPAQPGNVWGPGVIDRNREKLTTAANGRGYDAALKARLLR